jgi:hypothetical protein
VGTNEPGAAGYQNSHAAPPRIVLLSAAPPVCCRARPGIMLVRMRDRNLPRVRISHTL